MIVVQTKGGLGNQLFQYAVGRSVAVASNMELVIDSYWHSHPGFKETARSFELDRYGAKFRLASKTEEAMCMPFRSRFAPLIVWGQKFLPPSPPSLKLVLEKRQSASREFCRESGFLYLVGDWQNEAYFSDIRDVLLKDLVPKDPPGVGDRKIMDLIKNSISVSIHVRRGDYVTSRSASSYHGLCSIDYYHRAIAYLAERISTPTLFVFSDDPEWVKIHLKPSFPTYYVDHNLPEDAFQDLRLMSLCKHHIIANSSFSWWGAWLSVFAESLVIAPKRWFAVDRPAPGLIPDRWISLEG